MKLPSTDGGVVTAADHKAWVASAMSEATLQANIDQLARQLGWLFYHTHDSRRSQAGFPDLVLVKGGRLIFAELKSERGRESTDQKVWAARLREVEAATYAAGPLGVEVFLWRPIDWVEDTILGILTGGAA